MTEYNIKDIAKKLQLWLSDEGVFQKKIMDESTNFHFLINFPPKSPFHMDIMQPKEKQDSILILEATNVSVEHQKKIKELKQADKEEFLWELRLALNERATEFELIHSENVLQRFIISTIIYFDGLTKDKLMRAIREVHKSTLHAIWMIQKRFGTFEIREEGKTSLDRMYH